MKDVSEVWSRGYGVWNVGPSKAVRPGIQRLGLHFSGLGGV